MNKMDKVTGAKAGKAARAKFKGYSRTGADPKDIMGNMRKVADDIVSEEVVPEEIISKNSWNIPDGHRQTKKARKKK